MTNVAFAIRFTALVETEHQMCCFKSTICFCLWMAASVCAQGPLPQVEFSAGPNGSRKIVAEGSTLLVDDQPQFPRIIQHNGESFTFLKSLGFNTIQLRSPATLQQLQQAADADMFLVCLPPASLDRGSITRSYEPVLAWSLGNELGTNQIQLTREQIIDVRDVDPMKRPVFAHAQSNWKNYGQLADILGLGRPTIGTNFRLNQYGRWINNKTAGQIQPIWTDIQTQLPSPLQQQIRAFVNGKTPALPLQHQQIRFQIYQAIFAGSRGLRFLSSSRLDATDPETLLRAKSLQWCLAHVQQLQPWLAGGLVRNRSSLATDDRSVFTVELPGSQLMLIQRTNGFEQWSAGNLPLKTVDLASVSNSTGDRVYRLDERGATLLTDRSTLPGTRIKIPRSACCAAVLIAADPMVVTRLNSQVSGTPTGLQQRLELVEQSLAYLQLTEQNLAATGVGFPIVGASRQQAQSAFNSAQQQVSGGNFEIALENLERADAAIAAVGRDLIQQHLNGSGTFASPLLKHLGLIPVHLESSARFADATWNPNSLAAGDFENLEQMTLAGWKNRRYQQTGLATRVELEKAAAVDGTYGLKLTIEADSFASAQMNTSPLWIESAPVAVKSGQLVRIHGYVNVINRGRTEHVLEISDSIAGNELAIPFNSTGGWKPFTIYRVATRDANIQLELAMHGVGTAMLDEITVRTMDPAETEQQATAVDGQIK